MSADDRPSGGLGRVFLVAHGLDAESVETVAVFSALDESLRLARRLWYGATWGQVVEVRSFRVYASVAAATGDAPGDLTGADLADRVRSWPGERVRRSVRLWENGRPLAPTAILVCDALDHPVVV